MSPDRIVTRPQLVSDLRALGVRPGDLLMTHESCKAIGWIVGGPHEVGEAILAAAGPGGTWMKYVCSEDSTYGLDRYPSEVRAAYRAAFPPYDPRTTRAHRPYGILCEYLRTWPGAVRSAHPDGSFAAVGPLAAQLMEPHPLQDGMGPGSPLERFLEARGRVLLLGSPRSDVTFLHHGEYCAEVPTKRRVRYEAPIRTAEGVSWVEIGELDSEHGIADFGLGDRDYFEAITTAFIDAGHARTGRVGHADAVLMEAPALHAFTVGWMEERYVGA